MALAEHDLRQRGHGDVTGMRQSGHGRMLNTESVYALEMLERERAVAEDLHTRYSELILPEHVGLRAARDRLLARMDCVETDH